VNASSDLRRLAFPFLCLRTHVAARPRRIPAATDPASERYAVAPLARLSGVPLAIGTHGPGVIPYVVA